MQNNGQAADLQKNTQNRNSKMVRGAKKVE